jgi:hypothetical protein
MNHDRRHDVPRTLATRNSRRHALTLLATLLAVGLLAALGIRPAHAGEMDPLTSSGLTLSELEEFVRDPPPQSICARTESSDDPDDLALCSVSCDRALFGTAFCFQQVGTAGRPMCGGVNICNLLENCTSNSDCGPRQFCAVTFCPGSANKCIPRCVEENP